MSTTRRATGRRRAGFSLVELTITIALTGLMAVGLANLLRHPISARESIGRRAELVALGEVAMARLVRDLENAVPKSVRVAGGGNALELMPVLLAAPYRGQEGVNAPGEPGEADHSALEDYLALSADQSFNVLGRIDDRPIAYGASFAAGTRLVVGPTSPASLWSDAASNVDPGSITPGSTGLSIFDDGDEDQLRLSSAHTFSAASPSQRFYLTGAPVSYVCDPSDRSFWRIDGYGTHLAQPTDRSSAPLASGGAARAADEVERCRFAYAPGSASQGGLVTVELVLERDDERIRYFSQVEVGHAP